MSVSDDEESRTPSSPTSLASQFMTQARHFTNQVVKSSTGETATLHSREPHAASSGNDLGSIFMTKARQLTGQRFDVSPFSPVSFAERSTFKLGQGGKTGIDGRYASIAHHTHAHKFDLQLPRHEPATLCLSANSPGSLHQSIKFGLAILVFIRPSEIHVWGMSMPCNNIIERYFCASQDLTI